MDLTLVKKEYIPIDQMHYRNIYVEFFQDPVAGQVIGCWNTSVVEFGTGNSLYKDDAKLLIDDQLDTVTKFEQFQNCSGAKLKYFQNTAAHRDLQLTYRGRLVKIYLDPGDQPAQLQLIIDDAVSEINKLINH